uniref:Nucleoside-diphosphate kinase n=1 Tax=Oncorhynchus tshawytscha TaxID=74940 RepID=A0A8C8BTN2_ONCTS
MVKYSSHPSHRLFSLLPHGKQYRSAKSRSTRLLNIVSVLGGPGAGKGTHRAYGCTHLSAGNLLRLIGSYIKDGKIVPVEITINLLRKAMEETMQLDQSKLRFLIDGFLRNQDHFQGWTCVMEGKADVQFVLFFDYSNQLCFDRGCLEKRRGTDIQSTRPVIELNEQQRKVYTVDASRSVFAEVKRILQLPVYPPMQLTLH